MLLLCGEESLVFVAEYLGEVPLATASLVLMFLCTISSFVSETEFSKMTLKGYDSSMISS